MLRLLLLRLVVVVVVVVTTMTMMMASDVLPQSLLLGSSVLKPHLDHTHVEPGLGAEFLAHLSRRLAAVVVGAFQRVQLLAGDCRPRSLASSAASQHPTAVVDVRTAIYTRRDVFVRFSLGGGSGFGLAMTDRATIAGMEVTKLVPWNSLLN